MDVMDQIMRDKTVEPPTAIKRLDCWLAWKYQTKANGKTIKVPHYIDGGKRLANGTQNDRQRLCSYEKAKRMSDNFDGLMFALFPENNITCIDVDNVNGDFQRAAKILGDTYMEVSPGGDGIHAFYFGQLCNGSNRDDLEIDIFSSKNQITFTGNAIKDTEVMPISPSFMAYYNQHFAPKEDFTFENEIKMGKSLDEVEKWLEYIDSDCDYNTWITVAQALQHEFGHEGAELFDTWSSTATSYEGSDETLKKYESFRGTEGKKAVTCASILYLAKQNGYSDQPEQLEEIPEPTSIPDRKFKVLKCSDLVQLPPQKWLIKHIIPERSLIVGFGAPGSGKSFVGLDMAYHISEGLPWYDKKVKKAKVLYLAAEGGAGIKKRLDALATVHNMELEDLHFDVIFGVPSLVNTDDMKDIGLSLKDGEYELIIVDTMAQCMAGANENDFADMSLALKNCAVLIEQCNTSVFLIHHSGKDAEKGARGHSTILGNCDTQLMFTRDEDYREIQIKKQKDQDDSEKFAYQLQVVDLGMDDDGDLISSCVVAPCELNENGKSGRKLGHKQKLVLDLLHKLIPEDGTGLSVEAFIEDARHEFGQPKEGKRDNRASQAKRAFKQLIEREDCPFYERHGFIHKTL